MTSTPASTAPTPGSALAGTYLCFLLGGEQYGANVLHAREIIAMQEITPLPRTPEHVLGVINLRGRIVPVVDLRIELGLPAAPPAATTCIVVMEVSESDGAPVQMGCVVDAVSEVLTLGSEQIEPPPRIGGGAPVACLLGLAKVGSPARVVALLDVPRVLSAEAIAAEAAAGHPEAG